MNGHTPGPWSASESGFVYDAKHHQIAEVFSGSNWAMQANGLLIAAAPELLEVAQRLIAWCDKEPPRGEALYFVALAREAVAKATGA